MNRFLDAMNEQRSIRGGALLGGRTDAQRAAWNDAVEVAARFGDRYWRAHASEREFPRDLWRALGDAGLLGTLVPRLAGGREQGPGELAMVAAALASAGMPLLALITGPGLGLPAIARHGSSAHRETLLPRLLAGDEIVAFAITEADAGSNVLNLRTSLEPDGNGFRLRGAKQFTSVADVASHVLVVTRTTEETRTGFSLVLVPTNALGFAREESAVRLALPERQSTLRFDDVAIEREQVLGGPGAGLRVLAHAVVTERIASAATSCGLGAYALGLGIDRACTRSVFGGPLGRHQAVHHALARAAVDLRAAWLLLLDACEPPTAIRSDGAANMACFASGRAGYGAVDAALQVQGGLGYTHDSGLAVYHQAARLLRSAPVHAEGALNAVGETVLGLPRSYGSSGISVGRGPDPHSGSRSRS